MNVITFDQFVISNNYDRTHDQGHKNRAELIDAFLNKKAYVRINGGQRDGSIVRAIPDESYSLITRDQYNEAHALEEPPRNYSIDTIALRYSTYESYLLEFTYHYMSFELLYDDNRKVRAPYFYINGITFDWLVDYDGPTVHKFTKKLDKPELTLDQMFKDSLGQVVSLNDFAAVIQNGMIRVGQVSKLSDTGKSVKVKINGNEVQISHKSKILIINDDTKKVAMLQRLMKN